MASIARNLDVGVYSRRAEIKLMASWGARRKTLVTLSDRVPIAPMMKDMDYLVERVRLDLGELMLHVVGVHGANLFPRWCSQNLDDFHQLIDSGLAGEERLPQHELRHNASGGPDIYWGVSLGLPGGMEHPHTDFGGVIGRAENQFGRPIVAGADVRYIRLILDQDFSGPKVTEFEDSGGRVQQQVLGFDISVADPLGVDVGQGPEELIDIELDLYHGHGGLHLVEVP